MTNFKHVINKAMKDGMAKIEFEVFSRKEHVELCQIAFDLDLITKCGKLPDKATDGYSKGFTVSVDLNSQKEVKAFHELFNIEELEFAGGNEMELNEYIASDEFKKEMKALQMPVSVGHGGQSGY